MKGIALKEGNDAALDESTSVIVEHATRRPAVDAAIAAEIIDLLRKSNSPAGFRFVRLRDRVHGFSQHDSAQHVAAYGALLPNGFLWAERRLGQPVESSADQLLETGRQQTGPEVVAFNPQVFPQTDWEVLRSAVRRRSTCTAWITVEERGSCFRALVGSAGKGDAALAGIWRRDPFGRFFASALHPEVFRQHLGIDILPPPVGCAPASAPGATSPRLVILGTLAHHRDVYPGLLAAVGDAASAAGIAPEIVCLPPTGLGKDCWEAALQKADGLVLPGGSGVAQIPDQIGAATAAIRLGIPVLGICLGLQCLAVAVVRQWLGEPSANLEEADPHAQPLVVVRLHDQAGRPWHRLGSCRLRLVAGSKMASVYYGAAETWERLHHRYAINPTMIAALARAGLRVGATAVENELIVDGIELEGAGFALALQGHPELSSRADRPHPLIVNFLKHAEDHRSSGRIARGSPGIT